MSGRLTAALAAYPVIVLDGCDGTGKTTLAAALREHLGYTVTHSGRTPDGIDLADRYSQLLAMPGRIVLDRSFISELVYGPLLHGRSRITQQAAVSLAQDVAQRGGAIMHLTGAPESIAARLRSRDGTAPPVDRIRAIIDGFHAAFALLAEVAPVITADTTASVLSEHFGPESGALHKDAVRESTVHARRVLLDLRLNLSLQVDAGHRRQAEKEQRHISKLLANRAALLAPRIERLRNLALQKTELQGHVGRVEPLSDLILPGKLLAGPDVQFSPCRHARV
jgi:thymidylate kinase